MSTATLDAPVRTETWTDDLTVTEFEALLDSLEVAGFCNVDVRCTESGFFAVKMPQGLGVAGGWPNRRPRTPILIPSTTTAHRDHGASLLGRLSAQCR